MAVAVDEGRAGHARVTVAAVEQARSLFDDARGVSADESKWAIELNDKVNKMAYKPTQNFV